VYGDIGTSPLYAVNEIFFGHGRVAVSPENVRGSMSLVLWTLTIVVAFKYVVLVLRADNDGEGGIFALYGLLHKYKRRGVGFLLPALMLGAGLLFGDGVITPAISVLSAVEGLKIATPMFEHAVIPVTVVVLTALFAMQYVGTARVGSIFGPVLLCWFVTIGLLGAHQVMRYPAILQAAYPLHGVRFLRHAGLRSSLLVLGAVMLVVTGGEALYADMGHFGTRPIRMSWFALVYPALLLNYLGQGALLASGGRVAAPTYSSAWCRAPCSIRWSGSRWSRPSSRRKGLSLEPSRSLRRPSRWTSSHACGSYTRTTRMRARSTCPSSIGRCTPDASCS
jgi:KUP system potassium uptake protein